MTKVSRFTIQRYLNIRQAYSPTLASDQRRLAFLTNITGVPQVWQVPLPQQLGPILWPEQLTFGTERVMLARFSPHPGDGHPGDGRLIYSRDLGGNEKQQLFLLSADGASEINLTEGYGNAMHHFGTWFPSLAAATEEEGAGEHARILFAANRRDPALFDLYIQELPAEEEAALPPAQLVWQNEVPGYLTSMDVTSDGTRAVVVRTTSSFNHTLFEIDLASGEARELLSAPEWVRYFDCAYAPGNADLFLITDLDADYLYIACLNLESGILEPLVTPEWDCEALALSPDGGTLAYAVNAGGAHQIYVLDLAKGTPRATPSFSAAPGVLADGRLTFGPAGERLAFSFTSATRTADLYLWDIEEDVITAVTRSSHGGLPTSSFIAPQLIEYPTFDTHPNGETRHIPAWYYQPPVEPEDGGFPVVVMAHGGPESQVRASFHFLIQYLLQHGYAVLAPNVRGSTGYGKAYSHLDDVEQRMDSVADLAHAVHWLRAQEEVDGARVAVYGGSYGGFMVLASLTAYPELWTAGVNIVGISNLATFLENTSDYRRAHRAAEYGSLEEDREFLESIAPINHIDKIQVPLMVIHGANDPRVPLSEAQQLVEALSDRVPVTFLVFDDEGHGLVKLHNKRVAYPAIVNFLDEHLKRDAET